MAIQKINLGTEPLGEGGDTNRSANTKINENFTNPEHAASKLVGTSKGRIPLVEDTAKAAFSHAAVVTDSTTTEVPTSGILGITRYSALTSGPLGTPRATVISIATHVSSANLQIAVPWVSSQGERDVHIRYNQVSTAGATAWGRIYTSANTTKEDGTGYLVASSPVLKMQHDSFEKVHEAEQLDIDIKHIKTGVYEITGTTGLRENDGWNLKPPKDINGNVLFICEATESNGVITLKTYKKKFDFETVSIVSDYEQPTDIPEGAVVMFRFNDLPQETLGEEYSV